MTLTCVAGSPGESDDLRFRIASADVLDDGADQRFITQVLVPDMTKDADPHGSFWASAIRVYPSPAHSLNRAR